MPGEKRISNSKIDIEKIQPECLKVLQPLLIEMEEFLESLDQDEFVDSCINLLKTLTVAERHNLLKQPRSSSNSRTDPTF